MDVIGFLCVSLGSITVQLHDSLRSRCACACTEADFGSQNGDRAWRCTNEELRYVVRFFCGQKDSMQRIFIKKCFLFTVGSVFHVKRFTTGWQTFRRWRGWNGGAEVAETTVRRLLCCQFRRTGKAIGHVYQWWWRTCREKKCLFQVRILHILRFTSICDLFSDCPSYIVDGSTEKTELFCPRYRVAVKKTMGS
jgi:hypothetical protein